MNDVLLFVIRLPKTVVLGTIRIYQRLVSPDHGPLRRLFPYGVCKYEPTCSEYAYGAVDQFGIIQGLALACGRIFRCNPWSDGGIDPVPKRK